MVLKLRYGSSGSIQTPFEVHLLLVVLLRLNDIKLQTLNKYLKLIRDLLNTNQ